jgi:hypothetical protein
VAEPEEFAVVFCESSATRRLSPLAVADDVVDVTAVAFVLGGWGVALLRDEAAAASEAAGICGRDEAAAASEATCRIDLGNEILDGGLTWSGIT